MAEPRENRDRAEALASRVTVGIVTALPEERAALMAMLDEPVPWSISGRGTGRMYDLGEIAAQDGGKHVVALALAEMGNNIAAARGSLLLTHFPAIEAILMVGIAGGVPNPDRASEHVRLGDVVVSDRYGVIQYDFIKKTAKFEEVRSSPRPPDAQLLEAARHLESDAVAGARPWEAHVQRAAKLHGAMRPDPSTDVLHSSRPPFQALTHPLDRKRIDGQPRIFFGLIASANTLLKDPVKRDRLREQHGVKAVEMEASGIADATWMQRAGYLAVRGICDYCDKYKNDDWHRYAAVVAAAYARAVIERMASDGPSARPEDTSVEPLAMTPPMPYRSVGTSLSMLAAADHIVDQLAITRLHAHARQRGRNGAWETARQLAEQSLDLAKRAEEPLLLAETYRLLADTALHGLDYENAKLFYEEAARRFDALDLPKASSTARLLLVPLLLQFGHVERSARHVAWLRTYLGRAEPGPEDRSDIEDVLRLADAAQENAK